MHPMEVVSYGSLMKKLPDKVVSAEKKIKQKIRSQG